jgi:hypothetical protein
MLLDGDAGSAVTCDRPEHWDHLNHAAIGQSYRVAFDNTRGVVSGLVADYHQDV